LRTVAYIISGFVVVFLLAPILIIILMAFSSSSYLEFPPPGFSLQWFENFFGSAKWVKSALTSLEVAVWTVVLSTLLGTLAALGIRRLRGPSKAINLGLLVSPLMVPLVVLALGLYIIYVRIGLASTTFGLVLAHTALAVPYVVINVIAPLTNMSDTAERGARSLGANRLQAFRDVTLPAIYPGIFAGALFAFLTSFDEVIIAIFVTGVRTKTLPVLMWESVRTDLDPTIAAIAVILTAITVASLGISQYISRIPERKRKKLHGITEA
jgi:putative spermidine/putrescine transport system permease protein